VRSKRTKGFRERFAALPQPVQKRAKEAYQLFRTNPNHPSLHFKQIDPEDPSIYSARVGMSYRVVGTRQGDLIVWYWIGTHAEYDKLQ
jgi:mRNA-degrading endonuclease RelE of RelBE toxin-antitoxin system